VAAAAAVKINEIDARIRHRIVPPTPSMGNVRDMIDYCDV
jgi:hypothetical protein